MTIQTAKLKFKIFKTEFKICSSEKHYTFSDKQFQGLVFRLLRGTSMIELATSFAS